jgi:hypothetical protein
MDNDSKIIIGMGVIMLLLYSINTIGIAFLIGAIAYFAVIGYQFVMTYPIMEKDKPKVTHDNLCNCTLKL